MQPLWVRIDYCFIRQVFKYIYQRRADCASLIAGLICLFVGQFGHGQEIRFQREYEFLESMEDVYPDLNRTDVIARFGSDSFIMKFDENLNFIKKKALSNITYSNSDRNENTGDFAITGYGWVEYGTGPKFSLQTYNSETGTKFYWLDTLIGPIQGRQDVVWYDYARLISVSSQRTSPVSMDIHWVQGDNGSWGTGQKVSASSDLYVRKIVKGTSDVFYVLGSYEEAGGGPIFCMKFNEINELVWARNYEFSDWFSNEFDAKMSNGNLIICASASVESIESPNPVVINLDGDGQIRWAAMVILLEGSKFAKNGLSMKESSFMFMLHSEESGGMLYCEMDYSGELLDVIPISFKDSFIPRALFRTEAGNMVVGGYKVSGNEEVGVMGAVSDRGKSCSSRVLELPNALLLDYSNEINSNELAVVLSEVEELFTKVNTNTITDNVGPHKTICEGEIGIGLPSNTPIALCPGSNIVISPFGTENEYEFYEVGEEIKFLGTGSEMLLSPITTTTYEIVSVLGSLSQQFKVIVDDANCPSIKPELIVFDVITPNGDGRNEVFKIENIEHYKPVGVLIYGLWGELVYESEDYQNDWTGDGLPDGGYYYIVQLPNGDELRGMLSLKR